jgi:hypothetical protein
LVHLEVLLTSTQDRCVVCAKHTIGSEISLATWFEPNVPHHENIFWPYSTELLGDVGQMEARFGPFGDNVNLHAR